MRNLALVLLLLNIVFLTWQLVLFPQQNTESVDTSSITGTTLSTKTTVNSHPMPSSYTPTVAESKPFEEKIVRPIVVAQVVDKAGTMTVYPPSTPNQPPACFHAGPYTDKEKVEELINFLKSKENLNFEKFDVQTSQTRVLRSTWVYLPPFKSKQTAESAIKSLKQAGFKHYLIVAKGPFKNSISLGLYNKPLYAEIRVKKLRSKGYKNIKTQERYKDITKYVLNVKIPAIQQTLLLNLFKEKFQGPLLESVVCV